MTLAEFLASTKTSRLTFAQKVGATDSAVSRWATGERVPSGRFVAVIERETKGKVPASSWLSDQTKPRRVTSGKAGKRGGSNGLRRGRAS